MEKEFRFRGPGNLPIIPPLEESDEIEERDEQSAMTEDKKHSENLGLENFIELVSEKAKEF